MNTTKAKPDRAYLPRARARLGAVLLAASTLGLSGCVDKNMSDLESYVEDVLARKSKKIEPLPKLKPYELYSYVSGERQRKDPFQPFFEQTTGDVEQPKQCVPGVDPNCVAPDPNRNKEELEFYPLDSLRMVGTLSQDERLWGIVLSAEGTVHRVRVDNYMGKNHGRIIEIREEGMDIIEIVPNGQGGWLERPTRVALAE